MNVMEALLRGVEQGQRWNVDFKSKSIKLNGKYILRNGESKYSTQIDTEYMIPGIEHLYEEYKYSLPSERSERKRRKYFKALPIEKIDTMQLCIAENREMAQARLESFVLCGYLSGYDWSTMSGWFWQGKDKDLVILKNWF